MLDRSGDKGSDANELTERDRTEDAVDPESAVLLELTHLVSCSTSVDAILLELVAKTAE